MQKLKHEQTTIPFRSVRFAPQIIHERENNKESEIILQEQKERLSKQCFLVKKLLEQGVRLTVRNAMIQYGIGDLRRRCKD